MDSDRKWLRVSFAIYQRNYLPDGRVSESVTTVEELSDFGMPEAMDWVPPFVMNCKCIWEELSVFVVLSEAFGCAMIYWIMLFFL